jgi:peptidoglycan/xylan/chitin deacetylase (PgdA/CDA1 family)
MRRLFSAFFIGIFVLASIPHARAMQATTSENDSETQSKPVVGKQIALTFDDGPYGVPTAQILSILEAEHVPATFYLVGKNVHEYPSLVRREVADGDMIGNHSYDHSLHLASSSPQAFERNLLRAEHIIASTSGVAPNRFRPPYGLLSPTMRRVLMKDHFHSDMWTIDPRDWDHASSTSVLIVKTVLAEAAPNGIILMHDGRDTHIGYPRDNTVAALPIIIDRLEAEGYRFVTIDKIPTSTATST